MRFTKEQLNELKSKVSVYDIYCRYQNNEGYCPPELTGKTLICRCPKDDHEDINPSFSIYWSQDADHGQGDWRWTCYSCLGSDGWIKKVKGQYKSVKRDAIALLQWIKGYTFVQALDTINEDFNLGLVDLSSDDIPSESKREYYNTKKAFDYLRQSPAHLEKIGDYLIKERFLRIETLDEYQIGYDNLDHRYTFPIFMQNNLVGGMTKRIHPKFANPEVGFTPVKYWNTATNDFFKKRETFFGIQKSSPSQNDGIVITEGPFDVMMAKQCSKGKLDYVATLSASVTEIQMDYAMKYKNIYLILDNDKAGKKGIERIANVLMSKGIIPYIFDLGESNDLCDFITLKYTDYMLFEVNMEDLRNHDSIPLLDVKDALAIDELIIRDAIPFDEDKLTKPGGPLQNYLKNILKNKRELLEELKGMFPSPVLGNESFLSRLTDTFNLITSIPIPLESVEIKKKEVMNNARRLYQSLQGRPKPEPKTETVEEFLSNSFKNLFGNLECELT